MGSFSFPTRREDSVGLMFPFSPTQRQISDVIFQVLKINYDEIIGFQPLGKSKVVIQFSKSYVFHSFCDKYDEKDIDVGNGKLVRIVNLSRQYTYVSIRYAPFNMDNALLERILMKYGKVFGIRLNRYAHGKEEGLLNGTRTARMELKRSIPSSMNIHGFNIVFYYNGQMKTCYKCGRENHMAAECSYEVEDRINVFSITDFPEIKGKKTNAEEERNKNTTETLQDNQGNEEHGKSISDERRSEDEIQHETTGKEHDTVEDGIQHEATGKEHDTVDDGIQHEATGKEDDTVEDGIQHEATGKEPDKTAVPEREVVFIGDSISRSNQSKEDEILMEEKNVENKDENESEITKKEVTVEIHKEGEQDNDTIDFSQAGITEEDQAMCRALEIYTDQQKDREMEIVEETSDSEEESGSINTEEDAITDSLEDVRMSSEGDQWKVEVKKCGKLKIRKSKDRRTTKVKRRKLFK